MPTPNPTLQFLQEKAVQARYFNFFLQYGQ